ncbi:BREX-1 system phosphatase PglZ type A [Namhaeicola litoreus]|uniref:BREX-1 system phosphatase PglZ type A n=1 Tax=Namhaeicola litoreus TaxID=1052145 RepID=A0ABW3Y072_9FLAO
MIKEKIVKYFQQYPQLKILFFFDEKKEYEEELDKMELPNIYIVKYENNPFSIKWKLVDEFKDKKVFLYLPLPHPLTQEAYHKFPLLGLLIANKELQLDNVGSFMEEFGLQRHQKSLISKYIQELKYTGVQDVCRPILNASNFQVPAIQKGLLSAFLKFKTIESWPFLMAKLITLSPPEQEKELNRVVKKIKDLDMEELVCEKLKAVSGTTLNELSQENLKNVVRSIVYNKIMQTIDEVKTNDPYAKFKIKDLTQITQLNQMLHEVDRGPIKNDFNAVLDELSKEIKGSKLIEVYGESAPFAEYNTEMIWEVIKELQDQISSAPKVVAQKLEQISLQQQINPHVMQAMRFLIQVTKTHEAIQKNTTYILNKPEEYIQAYTELGYKVDQAYRKAIRLFKEIDTLEIPKNIHLEKINVDLNKAYDKHTDQLNREWLKCLNHFQFDYKNIQVPKQYDFYQTQVAHLDQKVVVIISDALRYEAAVELLSEMHGDTKNTAEIQYQLASIPSKTNIGMSQLLPGEKIFNSGEITIDGISSSGTENRSKILRLVNKESRAIQYSDLDGLSREELREIFKDTVVYVYHDIIDATGDKKPSERGAFRAVEETIQELKKFVKLLHGSYNVAKVIVTSDHGFLYNDIEIKEKDKEEIPVKENIQSHNRYFITEEKQNLDLAYSIPLSATTVFTDNVFVNIPYSVNRYKKQGVGHQFVHGGGSLQELIVPVIESARKREKVSKKVRPMLLNRNRLKIVSNILKVNLLQETEVSRFEKECTLKLGLYIGNKLVSKLETLLLNFTAEAPSDRMTRTELVLAAEAAGEPFLKLKIFDEEDMLNPLIEERIQNDTLIQQDF